ncbi:ricin-type beta-trefoil lectin domain protein [Kitasatospora sp. NBC_00315]|uniref:ricin-type beta-trefoil lectin domain protein n=1 Tax=Kitasatospora sp. NBC_00315 TaxID=2975963 RepID=UPI00324350AB
MFNRLKSLSGLSAIATLAATGAVGLMAATPASASSPNPWPAHVFAPFADTWSGNITLSGVANAYGTKFFTIAFADGANCRWSIGQQASLQSQIDSLRAQGGDVSLSFGGYGSDNALTELGDSCSSPQAAAAQIESAVTTFNLSHIDFDIEANSLTNQAGIDRRNKALAQVRSWAAGAGRQLAVSVTLPATPGGLGSPEMNVLNNGRSNGFTPDVVNLMTMDYATAGTEMGDASNRALDASASQVAQAFGISTAAAYARLGNTPMIGQNDSAGEVFTLADAAKVESYAASKGIALLSYWSQNRDNGGCAGSTAASGTCSGVSQNTGDFARTFQPFTSGTGGTGPVTSGVAGKCLDDFAGASANGTKADLWDCNGTPAQQWTISGNTLRTNGKCLDITNNATTNGSLAELWDCNGGANQTWQTGANGSLVNPASGRCLDDPGFATANGTQLDIWDCNGGANQRWTHS